MNNNYFRGQLWHFLGLTCYLIHSCRNFGLVIKYWFIISMWKTINYFSKTRSRYFVPRNLETVAFKVKVNSRLQYFNVFFQRISRDLLCRSSILLLHIWIINDDIKCSFLLLKPQSIKCTVFILKCLQTLAEGCLSSKLRKTLDRSRSLKSFVSFLTRFMQQKRELRERNN